jgi:hypothetical protein
MACASLFASTTIGVDDVRRASKRVHVFVDLGAELLIAFAAGIRPGNPLCPAVGLFQGCVTLAHFVFMVVVQPTASDELNFFIGWVRISQTALCVLLSVLAIRGPSADYENAGIAAGWVAVVTLMTITVTAGFLVYRGLHLLLTDGLRCVRRRRRADDGSDAGESGSGSSSESTQNDSLQRRTDDSASPEVQKPTGIVVELEGRSSPPKPTIPRYVPPTVPLLAAIPSAAEQRHNPLAESVSAGFESDEGGADEEFSGSESEIAGGTRARRRPVSPSAARSASQRSPRSASPPADHDTTRRKMLVNRVSQAVVVRNRTLRESRPQYRGTPPPPDEEPLVFPPAWDAEL